MIGVLIFAVDAKLRRTLEQLPQKDSAIAIVHIADDQPSLVRLAETSNVDVVLVQRMPTPELLAEWRVRRNAPPRCFSWTLRTGGLRQTFSCGGVSNLTVIYRFSGNHRHYQDGR